MKRKRLLRGPVLLGFAELFDSAYGDPETPKPYLMVTPSSVGRVLLPFPCPRCDKANCDAVDPRTRDGYRDADRGFSWCPACGYRYVLNTKGVPLFGPLEPGAQSAPPHITYRNILEPKGGPNDDDGLSLMGVD